MLAEEFWVKSIQRAFAIRLLQQPYTTYLTRPLTSWRLQAFLLLLDLWVVAVHPALPTADDPRSLNDPEVILGLLMEILADIVLLRLHGAITNSQVQVVTKMQVRQVSMLIV